MGNPLQRRFGAPIRDGAVPLPTNEQYAGALLDPGSAFADDDLRECLPVLDRSGRPVAVAGSFGTVFRFSDPMRRPIAVKCFTRYAENPGSVQRRYAFISSVLSRLHHRWKVDFEVLTKGVLVGTQWHPILKMEWVQGDSLGAFIERNTRRPGALATVAHRFAGLVSDLTQDGLAHGDLHQGNILVEGSGKLRLIDYGGMYVPGLEPLGVPERGHEHYQSPERDVQFGPDLDRFSAWVIYGSLVALTIEPTLWIRLRAGRSEQLLFNQSDFCDPDASPALRALDESGKRPLQALGEVLREVWGAGLARIPRLDTTLLPAPAFLAA
jgi:serine/threonine protein kinase